MSKHVIASVAKQSKLKIASSLTLLATTFFLSQNIFFAEDNPLIDIKEVNPRILMEIRYATPDNFTHETLYPEARCLLLREVAFKVSLVQQSLEKRGLGLKIFDGYRPLSVQKKMWAVYPVEGFVANPLKGSNHNRGAAVDLTLVDAKGHELPMPSAYDEFSKRSYRNYAGGSAEQRQNRQILEDEMSKEGFHGLTTEWWHFDYKNAKLFPVLDLPFSSVDKLPLPVSLIKEGNRGRLKS